MVLPLEYHFDEAELEQYGWAKSRHRDTREELLAAMIRRKVKRKPLELEWRELTFVGRIVVTVKSWCQLEPHELEERRNTNRRKWAAHRPRGR